MKEQKDPIIFMIFSFSSFQVQQVNWQSWKAWSQIEPSLATEKRLPVASNAMDIILIVLYVLNV